MHWIDTIGSELLQCTSLKASLSSTDSVWTQKCRHGANEESIMFNQKTWLVDIRQSKQAKVSKSAEKSTKYTNCLSKRNKQTLGDAGKLLYWNKII